jgi:hypothetical protein
MRVGDRVQGTIINGKYRTDYTGTVYAIAKGGKEAVIERDDGITGSGLRIPGYPDEGLGWTVTKGNKKWYATVGKGRLKIMPRSKNYSWGIGFDTGDSSCDGGSSGSFEKFIQEVKEIIDDPKNSNIRISIEKD